MSNDYPFHFSGNNASILRQTNKKVNKKKSINTIDKQMKVFPVDQI